MLPKPAYPDPLHPDVGNPDMLARLPLAARVVLDVGCHTGALGAAYKARNPRARVLGIEADRGAAAIAATRLDAVAAVDLEADPLPFDLREGLDCIIYGDVLEHLRDPWAVLARQMTALNRDGTVLVCVPNVEHWSFAARLLRGDWDYEASGLFDATHLRWFTSRTMRAGLERLGLSVCDVTPRIFGRAEAQSFLDRIAPALPALGVDAEEYAVRALPLQYIWRAQREPRPALHVAATMLAPIGGVSDVRIVYPQRAIATDPTVVTSISSVTDFPELPEETPKICVLHRPVLNGAAGRATLRHLLDRNWLIVTEFDDHPDHFPAMRVSEQYSFSGVHAVQASTEELGKNSTGPQSGGRGVSECDARLARATQFFRYGKPDLFLRCAEPARGLGRVPAHVEPGGGGRPRKIEISDRA
jgi:SAM-dependent methyltransferase